MYPYSGERDWGEGALMFQPDTKCILYSDTAGTVFGFLRIFDNGWDIRDKDEKPIDLYQNRYEIGYYFHLGYFKLTKANDSNSEDYYSCFDHVRAGGLFLEKSEVKEKGGVYSSYVDLIFKYSKGLTYDSFPRIGVNLRDMCLNIRKGPGLKFEIIGCVPSNQDQENESRIEILERNGDWAKVHVLNMKFVGEYPKQEEMGPDWAACPNTIISELTGWMKVVDENGFPKIWFSSAW
ncbi:MAG TPA: SH3 domain-containing protein [Saprospiraceae bacterium]|nr:SH3 domain-containing protein [Saprospiraceae bacterium]